MVGASSSRPGSSDSLLPLPHRPRQNPEPADLPGRILSAIWWKRPHWTCRTRTDCAARWRSGYPLQHLLDLVRPPAVHFRQYRR